MNQADFERLNDYDKKGISGFSNQDMILGMIVLPQMDQKSAPKS